MRARRKTSSSSSRQSGRGAPNALMCAPGDSHSLKSTGAFDVVAVTTTSAPRTASSAEDVARTPSNCRAKFSACRGLQTRTSSNRRTSLKMAARLHPRADYRQHRRVRPGEILCGDRRYRGGAYFGDQTSVHADERLSGLGLEEEDRRVVGGDILALRIEGDKLDAEGRAGVSGHEAEEALVLGDGDHHAHRLHHLAARKVGESALHRGDHVLNAHQTAYGSFIQVHPCIPFLLQPIEKAQVGHLVYACRHTVGNTRPRGTRQV